MKNARFEFNGTKFTLKPGQSLNHYQGGQDEEGWSYSAFTLSFDGEQVTAECAYGGCDCDGRIDRYTDLILTPDGWQQSDAWQRDQYAELAGY